MDVLAEVFATTRLGCAAYGAIALDGEWGMRFDRQDKAGFHLVRSGRCWLRLADEKGALELTEGDVVVLPRGWRHVLSSGPRSAARPYLEVLAAQRASAGTPSTTSLVCGAFVFDTPEPHPLLSSLPHAIHVRTRGPGASTRLRSAMDLLEHELAEATAGADVVARRLMDVVLVYAIRSWFEGADEPTWTGALRDASTAKALAKIHADPRRDWTLDELAHASGVSRATLARRFRVLVGESPLAYLRRWRMTLAAQSLRRHDATVAELAMAAGYESEAAFHRAFTRERGVTPAEYRKAERRRALEAMRDAAWVEA